MCFQPQHYWCPSAGSAMDLIVGDREHQYPKGNRPTSGSRLGRLRSVALPCQNSCIAPASKSIQTAPGSGGRVTGAHVSPVADPGQTPRRRRTSEAGSGSAPVDAESHTHGSLPGPAIRVCSTADDPPRAARRISVEGGSEDIETAVSARPHPHTRRPPGPAAGISVAYSGNCTTSSNVKEA